MCAFIIDADPDCRDMLAVYLSAHGHEIMSFETYADAIRNLEMGIHPSLVIADTRMPDGKTYEQFVRVLRRNCCGTKVMIYSTDEDCSAKLADLRADYFTLKPHLIDERILQETRDLTVARIH